MCVQWFPQSNETETGWKCIEHKLVILKVAPYHYLLPQYKHNGHYGWMHCAFIPMSA